MLKNPRFLMIILAAALALSACLPTTGNDGATIDATQAAEMVASAVAQALDAQATQIAANLPAATATELPPTKTPIPAPATATLIPTITPIVLVPTTVPSSGGGGATTWDNSYYCTFNAGKKPAELEEFARGDSFDIKFTIVNSGTKTWEKGLDVIYYGGPDFTNGAFSATTVELPEMAPGDSYTVGPFDAWAPNESGRQVMTFKLEGGWCLPYIAIQVK